MFELPTILLISVGLGTIVGLGKALESWTLQIGGCLAIGWYYFLLLGNALMEITKFLNLSGG